MAAIEDKIRLLEEKIAVYESRLAQLEHANEELTDFIENAALPLHWVDHEGIIIWANEAELTSLGYAREEYIGQPIDRFHADQDVIRDILTRLKNNETLHNYKAQLKCKDGSVKHVLISSNVLRKDGQFIHTRCFTRDITAMVMEEQRKNDFVAMVSHELKTPLTTILSYIQVMLSRSKKSSDLFLTQALERTENQAKSMTRLINDFLNMSRLENTRTALSWDRFELHLLIQETIQEIQLNHHEHNIEFLHCGFMEVLADRAKLGQVLINLITNAIKYSPSLTTITVGCKLDGPNVKVFVRDRGIGISESDQKRLFERFYRVDNEHTRHITGFGIGLYLVAEILRCHDSVIKVESEIGKGSTFSFLLPLVIS